MRGLTLMTLMLGLSGCSIPNPYFGLTGDSTGDPATTTASSAPTSEAGTGTSTSTGTSTATSPTTTATSSAEVGTNDPATGDHATTSATESSGDPVDGSATDTEDPPMDECPLMNTALAPYLFKDGLPVDECGLEFYMTGKLQPGPVPTLTTDVSCDYPGFSATYTLGDGYEIPDVVSDGCFKIHVEWDNFDNDCKIRRYKVYPKGLPNEPVVVGAFSVQPLDLQVQQLSATNISWCGCPDVEDNCCIGHDPGDLSLQPPGHDPIAPMASGPAEIEGRPFELYNLQSWVGPGCMNEPTTDWHVDWIAVATP